MSAQFLIPRESSLDDLRTFYHPAIPSPLTHSSMPMPLIKNQTYAVPTAEAASFVDDCLGVANCLTDREKVPVVCSPTRGPDGTAANSLEAGTTVTHSPSGSGGSGAGRPPSPTVQNDMQPGHGAPDGTEPHTMAATQNLYSGILSIPDPMAQNQTPLGQTNGHSLFNTNTGGLIQLVDLHQGIGWGQQQQTFATVPTSQVVMPRIPSGSGSAGVDGSAFQQNILGGSATVMEESTAYDIQAVDSIQQDLHELGAAVPSHLVGSTEGSMTDLLHVGVNHSPGQDLLEQRKVEKTGDDKDYEEEDDDDDEDEDEEDEHINFRKRRHALEEPPSPTANKRQAPAVARRVAGKLSAPRPKARSRRCQGYSDEDEDAELAALHMRHTSDIGVPQRSSRRLQSKPSTGGHPLYDEDEFLMYEEDEGKVISGNKSNASKRATAVVSSVTAVLRRRTPRSFQATSGYPSHEEATPPRRARPTAAARQRTAARSGNETSRAGWAVMQARKSHPSSSSSRMKAHISRPDFKGRPSFSELIEAGFMRPGTYRFSVGNSDVTATVEDDGGISYNGSRYRAISKFALIVLRERNPARQSCDGWKEVGWNGEKLDILRARLQQHLRQQARRS